MSDPGAVQKRTFSTIGGEEKLDEMWNDIKFIKSGMEELGNLRETLKKLELIPKRITDLEEEVVALNKDIANC